MTLIRLIVVLFIVALFITHPIITFVGMIVATVFFFSFAYFMEKISKRK